MSDFMKDILGGDWPKAEVKQPESPVPGVMDPAMSAESVEGEKTSTVDVAPGPKPPIEKELTTAQHRKLEVKRNYTSAFVLRAKGMSLEEIAVELEFDLKRLKRKAREESWDQLCDKLPALRAPAPRPEHSLVDVKKVEAAAARIENNREESFNIVKRLRDRLVQWLDVTQVEYLYDEEGEKVLDDAGKLMVKALVMTPTVIKELASACKILNESLMLSLGDERILKGAANSGPGGSGNKLVQPITINLPLAVMQAKEGAVKDAERLVEALEEFPGDGVVELEVAPSQTGAVKAKHGHSVDFDNLGGGEDG